MKRDYNYIKIDEILEKNDFYDFHDSFKFGIESNSLNEKIIEDIFNDFGINEENCILKINDLDYNEVSEIDEFYRLFRYENEFLLYKVYVDYNDGFFTACIKPHKSFEDLVLFYKYAFEHGMFLSKVQVDKLFGNKNNPLLLIKMAYQILGYEYKETSDFDDFGIMKLHFVKNNSMYYLIGPLIDNDKYTDIYFDLLCFDSLVEDYSLRMDDSYQDLFNSFSDLLNNIHNSEYLKSILYTDEELTRLIGE